VSYRPALLHSVRDEARKTEGGGEAGLLALDLREGGREGGREGEKGNDESNLLACLPSLPPSLPPYPPSPVQKTTAEEQRPKSLKGRRGLVSKPLRPRKGGREGAVSIFGFHACMCPSFASHLPLLVLPFVLLPSSRSLCVCGVCINK